jgi:hypothetical protein
MNAKARTARRIVKARSTATRVTLRAVKAVATGAPQAAKTHLIAVGVDAATAKRFAGAFSTKVVPTLVGETVIKLKGRRTKKVAVKLYDLATFTARLSVYRPKDITAAGVFARAAHRLAA